MVIVNVNVYIFMFFKKNLRLSEAFFQLLDMRFKTLLASDPKNACDVTVSFNYMTKL